jgi:hypothetical protein
MSFEITDQISRPTLARITGGVYLLFIMTSVLANALGHIGLGDASQVYGSLTTDVGVFRLAFVIAFASAFFFLMAAWGLFVLLRPVNHDLALLFLVLNAVGAAIQCASLLQLLVALQVIDPASGLDAAQAHSLALVAINVYRAGFVTAQLFFGTWLFPLGYLVIRSGFLPRLFGVLLILDGVGELVWFLQAFLLPAYPAIKTPGTFVSLLAEVGLALWLLVRGVKDNPVGTPLSSTRTGIGATPR